LVIDEPELRTKLWVNINYFRNKLEQIGFNVGKSDSAIISLIFECQEQMLTMCQQLHFAGVYVNPVVYPAVSRRTPRLRVSLTAAFEMEDLTKTIAIMKALAQKDSHVIVRDYNRCR
jgi:glycine C-acetyltransferase